jgi:hypothetical protein
MDNGENEGGRRSRERAQRGRGNGLSDRRPDESHAGPRGKGRNRGSNPRTGRVDKLSGLDRGTGGSPTRISLPHARRGKAGSDDAPKIANTSTQEASPSAPFLAVTALCHSSHNPAAKTGVQLCLFFPFPERRFPQRTGLARLRDGKAVQRPSLCWPPHRPIIPHPPASVHL